MKKITPENTSTKDFHQFMLGAITPRPIALVSTKSKDGFFNVAPFSYFNAVSSIPPILMLSIGRKSNSGEKKDTLKNIDTSREFVVNLVRYDMLQQMLLTSVQFPPEISEFVKSGLTAIPADHVNAPRVMESPIQLECRVKEIIELGTGPGESSIILANVLCLHIDEDIIDLNNRIDPTKSDIVGRLGRSNYVRVSQENIKTAIQSITRIPLGYDALPDTIKKSTILSANDIARLAGSLEIPSSEEVKAIGDSLFPEIDLRSGQSIALIHRSIREAIRNDDIERALKIAILSGKINK